MELTLIAIFEHLLDEVGNVLLVGRTVVEQASMGLSLHPQNGSRDARVTRWKRGLEDVGGK